MQQQVKDFLFLVFFASILFFLFLGNHPLITPDEARYSEIPREMLVLKDYVTPHINFIKYFEKPPLFYWLQTLSIHLFGLSEFSLRFITAFMGLLGVIMTYFAGRRFYNHAIGILSGYILATSLLYYIMARFITIDMTLTVLLSATLFSFLFAQRSSEKHAFYWILSMYFFSALTTLTKGLIGVILPGGIILVWILIFEDWRNLKTYLPFSGIALWLILVLPWHILVQHRNPEFFNFYFIKQQFARYFTTYAHRNQAFWYMPLTLLAGFLPWVVFLPQTLKYSFPKWKNRFQNKEQIFLILWIVLIYCFFQFSESQLPPYLLPIFPPLAILTAHYLISNWQKKYIGVSFKKGVIAIIAITFVLLIGSNFAINYLIEGKTIKQLAVEVKPLLNDKDQVVSFHGYYQDLPFYLQRRVIIVGWGNSELTFGMQYQAMQDWFWSDETLWSKWKAAKGPRIVLFMSQNDYNTLSKMALEPMYLVAKTANDVVVTNKEFK